MKLAGHPIDLWSLGQLHIPIMGHVLYLPRLALDFPLIPKFAHLYAYHISKGGEESGWFIQFRKDSENLLFWNNMPKDRHQCLTS